MLLGMQDFDFAQISKLPKSNDYCPNQSLAQSFERFSATSPLKKFFIQKFSNFLLNVA